MTVTHPSCLCRFNRVISEEFTFDAKIIPTTMYINIHPSARCQNEHHNCSYHETSYTNYKCLTRYANEDMFILSTPLGHYFIDIDNETN